MARLVRYVRETGQENAASACCDQGHIADSRSGRGHTHVVNLVCGIREGSRIVVGKVDGREVLVEVGGAWGVFHG